MELPEGIEAAVIRGIGAYLRTADQNELPPALKRLRGFRPQALAKHKKELLAALEEGPTSALILQWLDEAKPSLSKDDVAVLRKAAERGESWHRDLIPPEPPQRGGRDVAELDKLRDELEREKARTARARAAERTAKDALRVAAESARSKDNELTREAATLSQESAELKKQVEGLRRKVEKLDEERSRERRRHERDLAKERDTNREAQTELKNLRRDLRERESKVIELTRVLERADSEPGEGDGPVIRPPEDPSKPQSRVPLKAPAGLLDDDPKSLDRWLRTEGVQLLVDGYNVSKSENGFAHLTLEDQRTRVIQAVNKLARKNGLTPIVVFDGAKIPPGTSRRARGPALVEYSAGEIADDHLVARLAELPADPVVLVTDDRELQDRARALGATIATTTQLLALAR
jgi:predicted RNA-binding protein with PIN domain